ncbi:MAG TPA: Ig-like domain-containing protein, partial [Thermoplasmata archaeon]|nr:Ig-like domain-containing protein [Thermoplasmata archaeon]
MRRSIEIACAFFVAFLVFVPVQRDALLDDFEDDYWVPFTHFHLGDRASAGYSADFAHSGKRSYHVEIHGWAVRDFGSAYGYAFFATRGAPLGELRLWLLYDSLRDGTRSPWNAFAAGISLELLDARYASLGTYRYVTAYRASQNGGRCAPTLSDVVLSEEPATGHWDEVARNPSADFPAAAWRSAAYVKVSVGFLCAAGLTGASYSLYFDDFVLEANSGDSDGDGLSDFEEETRVYTIQISGALSNLPIDVPGEAMVSLDGPRVSGDLVSGVVAVDLIHPRPDDLSVRLVVVNGTRALSQLLWDPGGYEQGVVLVSPTPGQSVRGTTRVQGRVSPALTAEWVRLVINGAARPAEPLDPSHRFALALPTDEYPEGVADAKVEALGGSADDVALAVSAATSLLVDRTPPELNLKSPAAGGTVAGLVVVSAAAFDALGVSLVELRVDGVRVDAREHEPFDFPFETADLPNGDHAFEVRAFDAAGNAASRSVTVRVNNKAVVPPPPCHPACNLTSGTTAGNLPPVRAEARGWSLGLASGDRLDYSEGLQIPWRTQVVRSGDVVSLILDAVRGAPVRRVDGTVGSELTAEEFLGSGVWRILVEDHGSGYGGYIQRVSVGFAVRTSPILADTDGDGLSDGLERSMPKMSPVIADSDDDGLTDAWESEPHLLRYMVDGLPREAWVKTDPFDPDTDHDGLLDGDEVNPPPGRNVTNPNDPDTDADGLLDGPERYRYGCDPTLSDTDSDGLTDGFEVTPHPMTLVIDGVPQTRSVVTSCTSQDTDQDGLTDWEEWHGAELWGFQTDPSDPDTDRDGLSDGDEIRGTNRRPTNPLNSDTDGDGLVDGIDLAPTETWAFPWTHTFAPGLVRFTQRFLAFDVHGLFAGIYTYRASDGACPFLSEHTADSTKSSDESVASVGSWINKTFLEGGETNYTSLGMSYAGLQGTGYSEAVYGTCTATAPRKYVIQYAYDTHRWDVDFMNVAAVNVSDEEGTLLEHATLEVPIVLDTAQSLIIQVAIGADADRGTRTSDVLIVPALQYSLHRNADFVAAPPFYRSVAVGAPVDNHSYQFTLRIPREVATAENSMARDDRRVAVLDVSPVWIRSASGNLLKTALNATSLTIGAAVTKVETLAERVLARLTVDLTDLNAFLPATMEGQESGLHGYGPYVVYVHRIGDSFDATAAQGADALWLSGNTETEIADFQATLTWTPREQWVRDGRDALGTDLAIMKIIRRGISLTGQLTSQLVATTAAVPAWTWAELTYERSYVTATTIGGVVDWTPIYLVSASGTRTVNVQTFSPDIDYPVTNSYTLEWELGNAEVLDDLDESILLSGARNRNVRTGLQGAAIGATIVVFGSQAILAYISGDFVKGSVYVAAGTTSVLGLVRSDVVLGRGVFKGQANYAGFKVRFGLAAALAVGAILASYELFLASESANGIETLSHYEAASTTALDTLVSVIPIYGPALALGWQLGLGVAVGVQLLLGVVPDRLAARIASSPGSTIVFSFEYVLGVEIPSEISEDALVKLLSVLNDAM